MIHAMFGFFGLGFEEWVLVLILLAVLVIGLAVVLGLVYLIVRTARKKQPANPPVPPCQTGGL